MSSFKIRPRIKLETDKNLELIKNDLNSALENNPNIVGTIAKKFIILKINKELRHFWSPQLTLMFEEDGSKTIIRGLYGPKQSIWAMFAFAYGSIAMLFTIILIWGAVEIQLYKETSLFYFLPFFVLLSLIIYIIAQFGQKLGAEQMFKLHHFFEDIINKDVKVE